MNTCQYSSWPEDMLLLLQALDVLLSSIYLLFALTATIHHVVKHVPSVSVVVHNYIILQSVSSALSAECGSTVGCCRDPVLGQLNKVFFCFLPRLRLRIWSRETGSTVPSLVSPLILHTQAESGACLLAGFRPLSATASTYTVNRHWVSPE